MCQRRCHSQWFTMPRARCILRGAAPFPHGATAHLLNGIDTGRREVDIDSAKLFEGRQRSWTEREAIVALRLVRVSSVHDGPDPDRVRSLVDEVAVPTRTAPRREGEREQRSQRAPDSIRILQQGIGDDFVRGERYFLRKVLRQCKCSGTRHL